jgi:hypothetical protein
MDQPRHGVDAAVGGRADRLTERLQFIAERTRVVPEAPERCRRCAECNEADDRAHEERCAHALRRYRAGSCPVRGEAW